MNNLKELKIWYEKLKEGSLDEMDFLYDENVFFKDPFNEIEGRDKLMKIFAYMFETLEKPQFVILDTIENSGSAFLTWDFFLRIKAKGYIFSFIFISERISQIQVYLIMITFFCNFPNNHQFLEFP